MKSRSTGIAGVLAVLSALVAALSALPGTGQVVTGSGLTNPGATTTVVVEGRDGQPLGCGAA